MKTKLTFSVLVVLFSLVVSSVNATHNAGAQITYHCLGNNRYQIVATIYRDCFGIALANPTLILRSSCYPTSMVVPTPIDTVDVTIPCPTAPLSSCYGGTSPGIQRYD